MNVTTWAQSKYGDHRRSAATTLDSVYSPSLLSQTKLTLPIHNLNLRHTMLLLIYNLQSVCGGMQARTYRGDAHTPRERWLKSRLA